MKDALLNDAKIILDFHQSNGTGVNKEPVIMPLDHLRVRELPV